jgi:hypothetical protein
MSLRCEEWFAIHEVDVDGGRGVIDGVRSFVICFHDWIARFRGGSRREGEGEREMKALELYWSSRGSIV